MSKSFYSMSPITIASASALPRKTGLLRNIFTLFPEDLEDMLIDLFTRYGIEHDNFILDNYIEPEIYWWQWKLRRKWCNRELTLKPLTLGMIIESAKAGHWLYG